MFIRIVFGGGSAEPVVEVDPAGGDNPEERDNPFVPDFALPSAQFLRWREIIDVFEIHRE
jgi:hypothetical protein